MRRFYGRLVIHLQGIRDTPHNYYFVLGSDSSHVKLKLMTVLSIVRDRIGDCRPLQKWGDEDSKIFPF